MPIRAEDMHTLPDGAKLPTTWHSACKHCGRGFAGKKNAEHCSDTCSAYTRRGDPPKPRTSKRDEEKKRIRVTLKVLAESIEAL